MTNKPVKKICVNASNPYEVIIGKGIIDSVGTLIKEVANTMQSLPQISTESVHVRGLGFLNSNTFLSLNSHIGLPKCLSGEESACQCKRCRKHGFSPWIRKIPWSRKWQPTPVLLPEKFHG